jgi:SAM-dependent methyltransferase
MPRIDNNKFYTSAIKIYGLTAKGVNWTSKQSQELRFDMILNMLPQNLSNTTIVDAGCGFGDFYLYMQKKKRTPKRYIGIDSLTDMCSISSYTTGCEIIEADICKDKLPSADFYICSGAMNTLEFFETYLFIQNCYKSSSIAFIFNILHGDKKSETYNYLSTLKIKNIAKELNIQEVKFIKEYMKNDITVGFFR